MQKRFSIVIPTGDRRRYLTLALADLAAQDFPASQYEVVVVDDTETGTNRELVEEAAAASSAPVRYVRRCGPRGINASRNTGVRRSTGEIVAFVDDDCRFAPGWLSALDSGVHAAPRAECFGGPIEVSLEPPHPRWCGRDAFPITFLDHGAHDRWIALVFGANFSVRRSALDRIGLFDEEHALYGDEVEWMLRLRRHDGLVRYVAGAGVTHTRFANDITLRQMLRSALLKGRRTADFDRAQGLEQPLRGVLWRAVRLTGHALVFRCWSAATHALQRYAYAAHSARARLSS
jgi:GT2 family glycosyltransferase